MFNHRESILVASWSPSLILWLKVLTWKVSNQGLRCVRRLKFDFEERMIRYWETGTAGSMSSCCIVSLSHTKEIKTASPCDCGSIKARHWIFYLEDFTRNLDCTKSLVRWHIHFIEVERIKKSGWLFGSPRFGVMSLVCDFWNEAWRRSGRGTFERETNDTIYWIDSSNQVLFSLFRYEFSDQSLWKYGHVWNGMVQLEKNM